MQLVLIPVLIIIGAILFFYADDILAGVNLNLPGGLNRDIESEQPIGQSGSAISQAPPPPPQPPGPPPSSLDTIITGGPLNNSVLSDTNQITFTFSGAVFPTDTEGTIGFETKVEGLEENWVASRGNSRTIALPSDPREYTFQVRSKLQGFVDATPATRAFRINTSPYFGKVHISSVSVAGVGRTSLITLTNNLPDGEFVPITGWQFKAITDTYTIPQGVADFARVDISSVQRQNIVLQRGTRVLISSANNPLANNMPYRPNQCFGELKKERSFPLGVPGNCAKVPKPTLKEVSSLSVSCQDYILRNIGGSCEFPEFEKVRTVTSDSTCFLHLQQLKKRFEATSGYEYCHQQRSFESGFFLNEWHIYTGGEEFMRPGHDRISLYDLDDLLVDEFIY